MASVCFTERGDCLFDLGRLDEAATAYEESIRRAEKRGDDRSAAVGKGQIGNVRLAQRRYKEALEAVEEARERFMRLDEPGSVAGCLHQIGLVYQKAGQVEAAEDAYRNSLAIKVRLGDVAGQASTLGQLGNLYADALGRPEEAVAFDRQAADKYLELRDTVSEAVARSNLAVRLKTLRRFNEARKEIGLAIAHKEQFGHASEPWRSWAILAAIETEAGNSIAAAEARRKAIECYLAYRRDGGENHNVDGRIALFVSQHLLTGDPAAAASSIQQIAADPDLPAWLGPFVQPLQAIVTGSRNRTLAESPDLNYTMAAEILFLIETLEKQE